ncbi:MAG: hypothetical protein JXR71_00405 [Bacteroidales bacterium]|nr:hypothetical protein [Bacteroidales bacterium]
MNKHSTNLIILAFLTAVAVFVSGCNSIFKSNTPYYKLSPTMKEYCFFDTGSYWVYQNDSTGISDTIKAGDIASYVAYHAQNDISPSFSYDVVETLYDTNSFNFASSGIFAGPDGASGQGGLYRIFFTDSTFVLAFAPGYKFGEEQLLGGMEGIYTNVDSIPNMSFNGMNFTSIYHTREKAVFAQGDTTNFDFYFAPKYGLIRWIRSYKGDTASFSLKAANLIQ